MLKHFGIDEIKAWKFVNTGKGYQRFPIAQSLICPLQTNTLKALDIKSLYQTYQIVNQF